MRASRTPDRPWIAPHPQRAHSQTGRLPFRMPLQTMAKAENSSPLSAVGRHFPHRLPTDCATEPLLNGLMVFPRAGKGKTSFVSCRSTGLHLGPMFEPVRQFESECKLGLCQGASAAIGSATAKFRARECLRRRFRFSANAYKRRS